MERVTHSPGMHAGGHHGMDHGAMDHGAIDGGHAAMDHAAMGHGDSGGAADAASPMNHAQMVHGGHGGAMAGMSMSMSFHGGYNETILFEFWKIDSIGGLIGSMVGCFLLAVMYEGLKFYREHLFRKNLRPSGSQYTRPGSQSTEGDENAPASADGISITTSSVRSADMSMWSCGHFILTLLHLVQVTLSYLLMLIFMTYNSWLCAATVVGAAVGYFLFGWRKTIVYEESDHCH